MRYWLFEDANYVKLLPLVYFRPVWELWVGAGPLLQKLMRNFSIDGLWAREYLHHTLLDTELPHPNILKHEDILFMNARIWPIDFPFNELDQLSPGEALQVEGEIVAFRGGEVFAECVKGGLIDIGKISQKATRVHQSSGQVFRYLWDLIDRNGPAIRHDVQKAKLGHIAGQVHPSAVFINHSQICVAENATIGAHVVLDASEGPIWIDEGVTVMHNSVIMGPAYIGPGCTIKIGAKIYENTALGPVCKIGGEVEGTIVQGYSNKQHDGFLGHAYLGSWVNLGADTNNSDLKNNYGEITVFLNGKPIKTGKRFLGLIMGDHSKTSINIMFNTGTIVGVNCNIFGAEMPPKFVPSFSWGGGSMGFQAYRLDKAMEVARIVMGRRNVTFTEKTKQLFEAVYTLSQQVEVRSME